MQDRMFVANDEAPPANGIVRSLRSTNEEGRYHEELLLQSQGHRQVVSSFTLKNRIKAQI